MPELTSSSSRIADENGLATVDFRSYLQQINEILNPLGMTVFAVPTGTGSLGAIDMDWTTTVSNPPTQAEVTAIRDQLIAIQKSHGALIEALQQAGVIG